MTTWGRDVKAGAGHMLAAMSGGGERGYARRRETGGAAAIPTPAPVPGPEGVEAAVGAPGRGDPRPAP